MRPRARRTLSDQGPLGVVSFNLQKLMRSGVLENKDENKPVKSEELPPSTELTFPWYSKG